MTIFNTDDYEQLSKMAAIQQLPEGVILKQLPARLFRNYTGYRLYLATGAAQLLVQ